MSGKTGPDRGKRLGRARNGDSNQIKIMKPKNTAQMKETGRSLNARGSDGVVSAAGGVGLFWTIVIGVSTIVTGSAFAQSAASGSGAGKAGRECELGRQYEMGIGVAADAIQAVKHYQAAAAQALPEAQYSLGRMYAAGEGVRQDFRKASDLFQKAAAQGYVLAMNRLGAMQERGEGSPKDAALALHWYAMAADRQHPGAAANLARLTSQMSVQQPARAISATPPSLEVASVSQSK